MKNLTKKQILDLRPTFKLYGITITEWFEISEGAGFYCIRSGLKHTDGVTKSPYYYEDCVGGKNAKSIALGKFNKWWNEIQTNKEETNGK